MKPLLLAALILLPLAALLPVSAGDQKPAKVFKLGIIGLDTSHAPAFAKVFNDPKAAGDVAGFRVVAAWPGGSQDIASSRDRVEGFTKQLRDKYGVEIVDSVEALLAKVDGVLLESVDGRPHLELARKCIKAGKPLFIDKPLAGSLADALAIYAMAKQAKVPVFSSSALRFSPGIVSMRKNEKIGDVLGCIAFSPCPYEEHHPDLFWYGIHGVETLFTIMGSGCKEVVRTQTPGVDVVTGTWKDGRVATFRGIRQGKADYGAYVFGSKGSGPSGGFGGYEPLVDAIGRFFKTGETPVGAEETLEIYAFMEAADESRRRGGVPVTIESVLAKARAK